MDNKASFKTVVLGMIVVGAILGGPGLYLNNVHGSWVGVVLLAIAGILAFIHMSMGGWLKGLVAVVIGFLVAQGVFWLMLKIFGDGGG
jgi:hypothetical protein